MNQKFAEKSHLSELLSNKKFIEIGQEAYLVYLRQFSNIGNLTEEETETLLKMCAERAFLAAEQFTSVFYDRM